MIIACLVSLMLCTACQEHTLGNLEISGDCLIETLTLDEQYAGTVDVPARTVTVYVPKDYDVRAMCITRLALSENARADVQEGDTLNMLSPRAVRVSNGDAYLEWTLRVRNEETHFATPAALFVGTAATKEKLLPEERQACYWMMKNIDQSQYCSLADFADKKVDLSACKVIWWHFHRDGGVDGKEAFENAAPEAVAAVSAFQRYLNNGGALLLSRYATYLPGYLSLNGNDPTDRFPNNCWGGKEASPETTDAPWSFFAVDAHHPLFADLAKGTDSATIYTCEAGYRITNSTAQWHIGNDWGGYSTLAEFETLTHAKAIAKGGDGAVVVWEFADEQEQAAPRPRILCIGTGCYDWYSIDGIYAGYHSNIDQMTMNAINYLTTNH